MAESSENQQSPTSERLKEVALLLKQADKLVKEGNLSAALELIAKARSYDSRHLYALAYEERVRTLLNAKQKEEQENAKAGVTKEAKEPRPQSQEKMGPALQHLSNLAIIEAQHSATVAAQQEQAVKLHKKEEEDRAKQEDLRRNAIEAKINAFLDRATNYIDRKEYNRAQDEIARAYLLDPVNAKIQALEGRIKKILEESRILDEQERQRKLEEERQKREESLRSKTLQLQKEKEEKLRRNEEERMYAQQEKVRQYIQHVNELYLANKLDEALSELAFVIVIDPLNEEVLRLEQKILEMQEKQQQEQLELYQRQLDERQKKRDAIANTIRKHIENADLLAKQKKFTDALRTITRATVLDPTNEELQQCEARILALQEEHIRQEEERKRELHEQIHRQQEEELLRLERADRDRVLHGESEESLIRKKSEKEKIAKYLERSRKFLAEGHFEVALGEVALAFIINPFDEEIKAIEQEILAAREEHQKQKNQSTQKAIHEELAQKNSVDKKITEHLQEADRLRSEHQYSKAFNEVAKAFILDPLSTVVQQYEQSMQEEFDKFLADQHNRKDEDEKTLEIRRHIDHAAELLKHELFEDALSEVVAGLTVDENNTELLTLKEAITQASREWQKRHTEEARNLEVQKYLVQGKELLTVGKCEEARENVLKAIALDPKKPEAQSLLSDIDTIMAQTRQYSEKEFQSERVKTHLAQAQSFVMANMLDKALVEILQGLVLDPGNGELAKLEQRVTALHEANISAFQAPGHSQQFQKTISKEEQDRLLKIHLRVASEFRAKKDFVQALNEIAHGLVIDPLNVDLLSLDTAVRKEQAEYDLKASQGLKLIYSGGKATG